MKKPTVQSLIKIADKVFSEYVRRRDANFQGYVACISCDKMVDWKYECDAGHYISRGFSALRYNEKNVNGQCKGCNRFGQNVHDKYAIGLMSKYGGTVLHELDSIKIGISLPLKSSKTSLRCTVEN